MDILENIHLLNKMTSQTFGNLLRKVKIELHVSSSSVDDETTAYKYAINKVDEQLKQYPSHFKDAKVKHLVRFKETLSLALITYQIVIDEYLKVKNLSSIPFNLKRYDLVNELMQDLIKKGQSTEDLAKSIVGEIRKPRLIEKDNLLSLEQIVSARIERDLFKGNKS
ncbi:MAG: hypothetical protein EOO44_19010 [Flavobacterium sp.]|nr:MAG: hypothetical protein EOO44_19010 [Flavobacterium sp.]